MILNPEEPSSGYSFSLEDDPEGNPKPEAKAIYIIYIQFHISDIGGQVGSIGGLCSLLKDFYIKDVNTEVVDVNFRTVIVPYIHL